jgi:putative oxidoreductase
MRELSQRGSSYAYALMRIVVGLLFLAHGLSKLVHFPVPPPGQMPPLLTYTAGPIELVCGLLVALGLFTRRAAFIASGQMAVAYFIVHFPKGFFPIANGGELAVLYCFVFLFISAYGAGSWSIDELRNTPRL